MNFSKHKNGSPLAAEKQLCVLGLGSNNSWGGHPPQELLTLAIEELSTILSGCRKSSVYKTAPLHVTDQDFFINTCVCGFFDGDPLSLLRFVQKTEAAHGRDRSRERRWGERSLDIDILLFCDTILNTPELVLPHPRLAERRFALQPLLELLPQAREPGSGRFYRDILDTLPDQGVEVFTSPQAAVIL
jgi:2-amino-4-hydroxy-6-hydroxymethyldihydropteridine diphosphokinase